MKIRAPLWLFLGVKLLTREWGISLALLVSLSLGMLGFVGLESLQSSLREHFQAQAQSIMGADLSIAARRKLGPDEQAAIESLLPRGTKQQKILSLFTMVAHGGSKSKLFNLVGVEIGSYPFYPGLELERLGRVTPATTQDLAEKKCWIAAHIRDRFGIDVGQTLEFGTARCTVSDVVTLDPTKISGATAFAQRIFVGQDLLASSELIGRKSLVTSRYLYLLPQAERSQASQWREKLTKHLEASDLRIASYQDSGSRTSRIIAYINDYLGLLAIIAYLLALIGTSFFFRTLLRAHSRDLSIVKSIGASPYLLKASYLFVVLLLATLATLVAAAGAYLILPWAQTILAPLLPEGFVAAIDIASIATIATIAWVGSLLAVLPVLAELGSKSSWALLKSKGQAAFRNKRRYSLYGTLNIFFYWLLAVRASNSFFTASIFVVMVIVTVVLSWSFARLGVYCLGKLLAKYSLAKLSLLAISRKATTTNSLLFAISSITFLLALLPQLRHVSVNELSDGNNKDQASLFLVDLQDEDLSDFYAGIRGWERSHGLDDSGILNVSPLIRARLTHINDVKLTAERFKELAMTREAEAQRRMENRSFNLSYRNSLMSSEKIVAGTAFADYSGSMPAISIESRFARRVGLEIGDTLSFDVSSKQIKGLVVSIRKVRWTSFHPNFFIVFQPGVLDDAPKTYLSALRTPRHLVAPLQNWIASHYSHVTIIATADIVEKINTLVAQVLAMINMMTWLVLAVGLTVAVGIIFFQHHQQRSEYTLQKAIGFSAAQLIYVEWLRLTTLVAIASGGGCLASLGSTYFLVRWVLDSEYLLNFGAIAAVFLLFTIALPLLGLLLGLRFFFAPGLRLLYQEEAAEL